MAKVLDFDLMHGKRCFVKLGVHGRWIVVNADDIVLAWSGSRWVPHHGGIAIDTQVSNLATREGAVQYAETFGFEIVTYMIPPSGNSIWCLICNRVSYNPNDVEERYCGNCHVFHKGEGVRT